MILNNHVVIIPGLGNEVGKHKWATNSWKKFGITTHVFDAKWRTEENGFKPKLDRALGFVPSFTVPIQGARNEIIP